MLVDPEFELWCDESGINSVQPLFKYIEFIRLSFPHLELMVSCSNLGIMEYFPVGQKRKGSSFIGF